MKFLFLPLASLFCLTGCQVAAGPADVADEGQPQLLVQYDKLISSLGNDCGAEVFGEGYQFPRPIQKSRSLELAPTYTLFRYASVFELNDRESKAFEQAQWQEMHYTHPDILLCVVERLEHPITSERRDFDFPAVALKMKVLDHPDADDPTNGVSFELYFYGDQPEGALRAWKAKQAPTSLKATNAQTY